MMGKNSGPSLQEIEPPAFGGRTPTLARRLPQIVLACEGEVKEIVTLSSRDSSLEVCRSV
jgi:hypothetical protein